MRSGRSSRFNFSQPITLNESGPSSPSLADSAKIFFSKAEKAASLQRAFTAQTGYRPTRNARRPMVQEVTLKSDESGRAVFSVKMGIYNIVQSRFEGTGPSATIEIAVVGEELKALRALAPTPSEGQSSNSTTLTFGDSFGSPPAKRRVK